jgi:hypothetical protein
MGRFRQGSIAKRLAIGVVAIYALLLQAFLAASAPAVAFSEETNCSFNSSTPGTPGSDAAGHHCPCCTLACAAACCAYTGTASALIVFPWRAASPIEFAPAPVRATRSFLKYHFAARGPPQHL